MHLLKINTVLGWTSVTMMYLSSYDIANGNISFSLSHDDSWLFLHDSLNILLQLKSPGFVKLNCKIYNFVTSDRMLIIAWSVFSSGFSFI